MVVNLHIDLETLQLIQGPGLRSAVSSLRFKRGDAARLRVVFLESGITPVTIGNPSGLEIQIGIKPRNQFDHSYLAHSTDWSMPAEGDDTPTYECELSLNTQQLNTALNVGSATDDELPEITLMGEITWREGNGEPTSTRTFLVVVENDVNRGTEGAPTDANPGNITLTGTIAASNLSGTNTGDNSPNSTSATAAQGDLADSALQPVPVDYRGAYNNGNGTYAIGSVVLYNELLYVKISNPGNPGYPPGGADWELFEPLIGSPAYDLWVQTSLASLGTVTTSTSSNLTGFISADGTAVSGATAGTTAATPNTLVMRDEYGGGVSFTTSDKDSASVIITNTGTKDDHFPVALSVAATGAGLGIGAYISSNNNTALIVSSTSGTGASINSASGEHLNVGNYKLIVANNGNTTLTGGLTCNGSAAITTGANSSTPFTVNIAAAASFPRRVIQFSNLDDNDFAYLNVGVFPNNTVWTLGGNGGTLAVTDDPRFTDARTPLAHTHTVSDITSIASQRLIGRHAGTTGAAQEVTVGNGLEFSGSGIRRSALTGDVTASAGSNATTIANDVVTNAKLANMATATIKGRVTAGTGDPEDLTAAQALQVIGAAAAAHTHTFGTTAGTFAQGDDSRLATVTAATTSPTPDTLVMRDSYGGGVYFTSSDVESTTVSITNTGTTDNSHPVALYVAATGGGAGIGARINSNNNTALQVTSTSGTGASITSDSGVNHATFGNNGNNRSFVARVAGAFGWFRGSNTARIQAADTLTGNRIYTLPDSSGTVALNGLLSAAGPYADDGEAGAAGVPDNCFYFQPSGAVVANIDHLSLDLAFALNKTLKARRGPTPTFVRASTATYVGPNEINVNFLFDSARYIVDLSQLTTGQAVLNGRYRWQANDTGLFYNGTAWALSQDGATIATSAPTSDAWRPDLADWSGTVAAITPTNRFGIVRAAISEPRYDYDPVTGVCRGLLIEEQRTNALLNSDILVTRSAAVTATARTLSFYGTGTVVLSGAHSATVVGTGAFPARTTLTFTPTAGTLTLTVTGTVQFAQLEIGTNASSYIPTTTAALTRSSDLCSITGAAFAGMYNDLAGTIFCEHTLNAIGGVTTPNTASIGGQQNGISMAVAGGSPSLWGIITTDESTQFGSDLGNLAFGVSRKSTMAFQHGGSAILCQNGTLGTQDNSVALPSDSLGGQSPSQMFLFQGQFVTIKSFRYFKTRLSNAKLQTLTTL